MKAGNEVAESLGLITARGGSKGLLRKNIRELAGKPLIAWTIEVSRKCRSLSRVVVSTEDQEIAEVAREYGAEVPFMRPDDLASDHASHISVVRHAVEWLKQHDEWSPDYAVTLLPTCPLRAAEDIDGAIDLADYQILVDNYNVGTTFAEGDFTFDGVVDLSDFIGFRLAFEAAAGGVAAVPEPGAMILATMALAGFAGTFRRRR